MRLLPRLGAPLDVGGVRIPNRVFLAPMSGVSDEPFRTRAQRHGAGLVVSEMVASGELARGRSKSAVRIKRPDVPIHVVQLAGREKEHMAEAARIAEGEGADIIDINMGCPAKKVTGGYAGSALMREPDRALSLIEAVVGAASVPVTLKMRLGWDDSCINAPDLAQRAEAAGIRMITVHGRTRCQFYKGAADWKAVALVKQAVAVPVVVNGDILGAAEAESALAASRADAIMMGRATYGQPWMAGAVAAEASAAVMTGIPASAAELADYVVSHYQDMLSLYGVEGGVRHARKHLGWYLDRHAPGLPPETRQAIMTSLDPNIVAGLLREAFGMAEATEGKAAA